MNQPWGVIGLAVVVMVYIYLSRRKDRSVEQKIILYLSNFEYYKNLSEESRLEFRKRVKEICTDKKFKGMNGLKVLDIMRIRIGASLVQLTYGFTEYQISGFNKILIFPDIFYHPTYRQKMKGFASETGLIAVSWPDFEKGYHDPDDNYNLGLHELAHALHINNAKQGDNDYFRRHFRYWSNKSVEDFYDLRSGTQGFLRKYGGNNFHEFFAVCVEHFFESPEEFYQTIPHLYIRTCVLLNQNPMNHTGNYFFTIDDFPEIRAKLNRGG